MIVLFVVDTSGSMNQRTSNGLTKLDCAKGAIEHFLKSRTRDTRNERYFLITCEDGVGAIKASWKSKFRDFVTAVKNLRATDLTCIGTALQRGFNLLNLYRLQTGIDNYGKGRMPWFLEPAVIICLTDGGQLTSSSRTVHTLSLPYTPTAGAELTKEPFRWDQRLFTVQLRFSGVNRRGGEPSCVGEKPTTGPMCEVTGGRCHSIYSMKGLMQCMDIISSCIVPGVVVNFELTAGSGNLKLTSSGGPSLLLPPGTTQPSSSEKIPPSALLHTFLVVRQASGFWPIPEAFVPHPQLTSLPARSAHPMLVVSTSDSDPFIIENFPCDEYELNPACPLVPALLSRKSNVAWKVYMTNSNGDGSLGHPFAFLKATSSRKGVALYVLPYNYPQLWPLLDELANTHKMQPPLKWCQEFEGYLGNIPPYYMPLMKIALKRFGAPGGLIPDHLDTPLNYAIVNILKKRKQQSKLESDRMAAELRKVQQQGVDSLSGVSGTGIIMGTGSISPPPSPITGSPSTSSSSSPSPSFYSTNLGGRGGGGGGGGSGSGGPPPRRGGILGRMHQHTGSGVPILSVDGSSSSSSSSIITTDPSESMFPSTDAYFVQQINSSPSTSTSTQNAFDIKNKDLLAYVSRLSRALVKKNISSSSHSPSSTTGIDPKHAVPIALMGNYHEVLMRKQTLRNIDPDADKNNVFFGNPYVRSDKTGRMADIDALDDNMARHQQSGSSFKRRKKRYLQKQHKQQKEKEKRKKKELQIVDNSSKGSILPPHGSKVQLNEIIEPKEASGGIVKRKDTESTRKNIPMTDINVTKKRRRISKEEEEEDKEDDEEGKERKEEIEKKEQKIYTKISVSSIDPLSWDIPTNKRFSDLSLLFNTREHRSDNQIYFWKNRETYEALYLAISTNDKALFSKYFSRLPEQTGHRACLQKLLVLAKSWKHKEFCEVLTSNLRNADTLDKNLNIGK